MTPEQLEEKLRILEHTSMIHAEVLATIAMQLAGITAAVEAALSTDREILSKLGMPKDEAHRRQDVAREAALSAAHKNVESALAMLGKLSAGTSQSPPDDKN